MIYEKKYIYINKNKRVYKLQAIITTYVNFYQDSQFSRELNI